MNATAADCIVCEMPGTKRNPNPGGAIYDCPRCGVFMLNVAAEADLPYLLRADPTGRSKMSHVLRRTQSPATRRRVIQSEELETSCAQQLPTPMRVADNLILFIGDSDPTATKWIEVTYCYLAATIGLPISSNHDEEGWLWLNNQLGSRFYSSRPLPQPGTLPNMVALQLTMSGWERYEALKRATVDSRIAFMAMKFGDSILDRVVDSCFKPAVARAGFELRKIIDRQSAGLIDDQMRAGIIASRFVLSDLTHGNQGAYWEAGFAEGLGRPVIYTCEKTAWREKKTHFDTNHLVTVIWDPNELDTAGRQLTAIIRATLRSEAKQTDD